MKISAKQYALTWLETLSQANATDWDQISHSMLKLLQKRNQLKLLPEIIRFVEKYNFEQQGLTPLTVTVAHDLDRATIEAAIEKVFAVSRTHLTINHDPNVLGGIRFETDNQRWDMTLKKQLDHLANSLTN